MAIKGSKDGLRSRGEEGKNNSFMVLSNIPSCALGAIDCYPERVLQTVRWATRSTPLSRSLDRSKSIAVFGMKRLVSLDPAVTHGYPNYLRALVD